MRDELMSEIIKLEWDMFSHVSNVGGPASCQMRPDTFKIMRKSQAATWSDELLASYLEDLKTATREGRNIMTEKYARMMESTFPEEYRKLAASLPPVDKETLQKMEEIVAINVGWKAELFDRYPRLSGKGRPLRTSEDSTGETSFETYLRGELKTYSARTITLLHELTLRQQQDGVNGAALNLLNQVQLPQGQVRKPARQVPLLRPEDFVEHTDEKEIQFLAAVFHAGSSFSFGLKIKAFQA